MASLPPPPPTEDWRPTPHASDLSNRGSEQPRSRVDTLADGSPSLLGNSVMLERDVIWNVLVDREKARAQQDFSIADAIKNYLQRHGITIDDRARRWYDENGRTGWRPNRDCRYKRTYQQREREREERRLVSGEADSGNPPPPPPPHPGPPPSASFIQVAAFAPASLLPGFYRLVYQVGEAHRLKSGDVRISDRCELSPLSVSLTYLFRGAYIWLHPSCCTPIPVSSWDQFGGPAVAYRLQVACLHTPFDLTMYGHDGDTHSEASSTANVANTSGTPWDPERLIPLWGWATYGVCTASSFEVWWEFIGDPAGSGHLLGTPPAVGLP